MHLSRQIEPRYRQLAEQLRGQLLSLRPGDYLPAEVQLAARYAVNRHTLRRAVDELVQEGRLLRQQGKGTQVLASPMIYPLKADSTYSASLSAQGHQVQAQLCQRALRQATAQESRHLELGPHEQVLVLITLRSIEDQPVSQIKHVFAATWAPLLADYQGGSLRHYLNQRELQLSRCFSLIGARLPSRDEAACLLMPRHAPLLSVQTLSRDAQGRPVELSLSISRADRFQYQLAL
ncbi:phosphonate metabolism transcriptional regulator PhnF [Pseudomonas sp. 5P_3.1_Bac2]|uniref:phosphonate metabolism transcriptional regulator PhnF n=1 Tax=Pseudomonas sp. 5P_3.1_Bac2 TaxID=2971617 RepID=UPI0021C596BF|nr:phosphonate metabolism transcriptional regulator PhnF [Pseudomonas sp. 5P_3.1_Bac2]MCU1715879.1 phosphonate metabolism transcriptional regulator PhnF [Pseudomonas sp. 5P_3.1_Bac2]